MQKRRTSILILCTKGEELLKQTQTAGQSVVGLQQYINSFNERWDALSRNLSNQKNVIDSSEKKKVFIEETQKILIMITEIVTYVETLYIELKNNPKERLIRIEVMLFLDYFKLYCNISEKGFCVNLFRILLYFL